MCPLMEESFNSNVFYRLIECKTLWCWTLHNTGCSEQSPIKSPVHAVACNKRTECEPSQLEGRESKVGLAESDATEEVTKRLAHKCGDTLNLSKIVGVKAHFRGAQARYEKHFWLVLKWVTLFGSHADLPTIA